MWTVDCGVATGELTFIIIIIIIEGVYVLVNCIGILMYHSLNNRLIFLYHEFFHRFPLCTCSHTPISSRRPRPMMVVITFTSYL